MKESRSHPHHETVKQSITKYINCDEYENNWYNEPPTEKEIKEIIARKKNGKAVRS